MLKQKLKISRQNAEKLIYDMTRYSDHIINRREPERAKKLSDDQIKQWFQMQQHPWSLLLEKIRDQKSHIPFVENLAPAQFTIETTAKDTLTIQHEGHEVARLSGAGQVSMFDYYAKYIAAMEAIEIAIKRSSYMDLLSAVTHGIASIESYISAKATLWNKHGNNPSIIIDDVSNLDKKLNDWLLIMSGYEMKRAGLIWNHFTHLREINNSKFKHNADGAHAISYEEMAKLINKFRTGIAEVLFKLHQLFNDLVPCAIIRGMYLPDTIVEI